MTALILIRLQRKVNLDKILENIADSQGAILLISNEFLKSEFITEKELPAILNKSDSDPDYKLILVLLDKETNFENFDFISLEKKKYINSKRTAIKSLAESESLVLVHKIIQEIKTTRNSSKASKESVKVLNRINLMRAMIEQLDINYESHITNLVQSYIASGGVNDLYTDTKISWDVELINFKQVVERTRHELMDYKNINKKMKALDESQYKQLEQVIELIINFQNKIERSVKRSCDDWEKFNSFDDAKKDKNSKGPHGEGEKIFLCLLCESFHKGFDHNTVEEEFDYQDMIQIEEDLRDVY